MLCLVLEGRRIILDLILANVDAYLHLYVSDLPIVTGMTLADVDELEGPGYEPQVISGWTPAEIRDQIAIAFSDPILFELTGPAVGPGVVHGYFVTQGTGGELLWIERGKHAPYVMKEAGDKLQVFPSFQLPAPDLTPCPPGYLAGGGLVVAGQGAPPP